MTMIEKVARAIQQKLNGLAPPHTPQSYWDDAARAALEAMREPSEEMVNAGFGALAIGEGVHDTWTAMIDAALAGK